MASSKYSTLVTSTFLILTYTTICFGQSSIDIASVDNTWKDQSDSEIVAALAKRLDELEAWKTKQETETVRLHSTIEEQKEKIEFLEKRLNEKCMFAETVPETSNGFSAGSANGQHGVGYDEGKRKSKVIGDDKVVKTRYWINRRENGMLDRSSSRRQVDDANRVAFFAMSTNQLTNLGTGQILEFDNVTTNIGHAYSSHTGAFTAPFDGTYVFSVSLMGQAHHETHYYVSKNGAELSWLYIHGTESPYTTSSHTVVVQLRQGDDIEVRNADAGEGIYGSRYSCFSGFLLYFDEPTGQIIG